MPAYWVDGLNGSDGNFGTSELDAKQTIAAGEALLANGDHLWIKNSAVYNESITIAAGGINYAPRSWEGYANNPGDGGIAVIDGESIRANGVTMSAARNNRVYRNIEVRNTTNTAWNMSTSQQNVFVNCNAIQPGLLGWSASGAWNKWQRCTATNTGNAGFSVGSSWMIGCQTRTTAGTAFQSSGALFMAFCSASGIGLANTGMVRPGGVGNKFYMVNCLLDGRGAADRRGVDFISPVTGNGTVVIVNCIFWRLAEGVRGSNTTATDYSTTSFMQNNIFSQVNQWFANGLTDARMPFLNVVNFGLTPAFVDGDAANYTPASVNAPQVQKGIDLQRNNTLGGMDIGPIQLTPTAGDTGGGGLLWPIGTTGGVA